MHPWDPRKAAQWPQMSRPAGTADWPQTPLTDAQGRSGSQQLIASSADDGKPGIDGTILCSLTLTKAEEVVLEVSVTLSAGQNSIRRGFDFVSNGEGVDNDQGNASLVIDYGSGGALQRVLIDLRNGSYQLPACEQVNVYVRVERPAEDAGSFAPPCLVQGCLSPGRHPTPSTPTYTFRRYELTSAGVEVDIPANARWVDCWVENSTAANLYGAGAPVLSLRGSNAQLIRDYTTGIWAPPFVQALAGMYWDGSEVDPLTLDTNVTCTGVVQFIVEF